MYFNIVLFSCYFFVPSFVFTWWAGWKSYAIIFCLHWSDPIRFYRFHLAPTPEKPNVSLLLCIILLMYECTSQIILINMNYLCCCLCALVFFFLPERILSIFCSFFWTTAPMPRGERERARWSAIGWKKKKRRTILINIFFLIKRRYGWI